MNQAPQNTGSYISHNATNRIISFEPPCLSFKLCDLVCNVVSIINTADSFCVWLYKIIE